MAQPSARYTLITAARLLDGSGAPPVEQAALLIDGPRVAGLGRAADVHAPNGASVDRREYRGAAHLPGPAGPPPPPPRRAHGELRRDRLEERWRTRRLAGS